MKVTARYLYSPSPSALPYYGEPLSGPLSSAMAHHIAHALFLQGLFCLDSGGDLLLRSPSLPV